MDGAGISQNQVTKIVVVRGPGPFTAVRTGLVVANTLSWLWDIPVYGIVYEKLLESADIEIITSQGLPRNQDLIRPWYGREPNITLPKRTSWV